MKCPKKSSRWEPGILSKPALAAKDARSLWKNPRRGRHTELMSPLNYAGTIHSHTQIHTYIHLYTEKTQTHPDHFKSIKTARAPRYQEFWGLRGWPRTVPVV